MHVHIQPDRQTAGAVGPVESIQPGAPSRPGTMKVGKHDQVAHDEILAANRPRTTQGQGGRRLHRKLPALLADIGSCTDDHPVTAGNHLTQNTRDLEPRRVLGCVHGCVLAGVRACILDLVLGGGPGLRFLDHHVVGPFEPAGHPGDVLQGRTHRHTAQQWQPAEVLGAARRHRNDSGHGDRGARRRLPPARQPTPTRALVIGHHDPPQDGVPQGLEIRRVDGRTDVGHLPRGWQRDQRRFH